MGHRTPEWKNKSLENQVLRFS